MGRLRPRFICSDYFSSFNNFIIFHNGLYLIYIYYGSLSFSLSLSLMINGIRTRRNVNRVDTGFAANNIAQKLQDALILLVEGLSRRLSIPFDDFLQSNRSEIFTWLSCAKLERSCTWRFLKCKAAISSSARNSSRHYVHRIFRSEEISGRPAVSFVGISTMVVYRGGWIEAVVPRPKSASHLYMTGRRSSRLARAPGDSRYPKLLITLHPRRARYRAWVSHYHVNIVVQLEG